MNEEVDWQVTVADGKYTLQHFRNGGGRALRHGEEWPARNLIGDNLVFALGVDLLGVQTEVVLLKSKLANAEEELRRASTLLKQYQHRDYTDL